MDQQTASLATRPQSAAPAAKTQQAMADEASQPQAFSPQYALEPQARPASATTAANAQRPLAAGAGAADAASRMRSRPSPDFLADRHQPPPGCFGAQASRLVPARTRLQLPRARAACAPRVIYRSAAVVGIFVLEYSNDAGCRSSQAWTRRRCTRPCWSASGSASP